jgi:hypothetical protein
MAEVKAAIGRGDLYPLDISEEVTAAVEKLDALRSSNQKIKDYLAQDEMFGAELTPVSRMMLEQFDKNMRSAKAMTDIIGGYYDGVREAGNPNQADMFGGRAPIREGLLNQAIVDANPAGKRLTERIAADYDKFVREYSANLLRKNLMKSSKPDTPTEALAIPSTAASSTPIVRNSKISHRAAAEELVKSLNSARKVTLEELKSIPTPKSPPMS